MSESMNSIIKSMNEWKAKTPDLMILSLYHLQNYLIIEFNRGKNGNGS